MKLLVVDNYVKTKEKLGYLTDAISEICPAQIDVVDFEDVSKIRNGYDATILSGSDSSLTNPQTPPKYEGVFEFVRTYQKPLLGICFGHELIGAAYGGRVVRLGREFKGYYPIELLTKDPLFDGLPNRITVYEGHAKVVGRIMPGFLHLARALNYDVEAFRHSEKPIYGVQFHPERSDEEHPLGKTILENFIRIAGSP